MAITEPQSTAADMLRPLTLDDYIGQQRMKAELTVRVNSALQREQPLPHTLLIGPAGSGKTSLAAIIARMMYTECTTFEMPFSSESYR
ncbi:MAG: AAA family ATPase, partial [Pseudonocardiaceae bacterium]